MPDVIYVGTTPSEETCAQLGQPGYYERARAECRALVKQLRRVFGPEPDGAKLSIKSCEHDFGTYYEVVCACDDQPEAMDYALRCESQTPERWDDQARDELQAQGFCAIPGCDHTTVGCLERSQHGEGNEERSKNQR